MTGTVTHGALLNFFVQREIKWQYHHHHRFVFTDIAHQRGVYSSSMFTPGENRRLAGGDQTTNIQRLH